VLKGPFGEPLRVSGKFGDANPIRWSTKYQDFETGLVYYPGPDGGRNYDIPLGRWLQPDRIGELGGPNLYGFVSNNPVNYVDPLGLQNFLDAQGNAMSGNGVDLSFHSQSVNSNSNSNPKNAWDDNSTFTLMAHGWGKGDPFIKDQRLLASGDNTGPSVPSLKASQLWNIVKRHPSWAGSEVGILYSCQTGMGKNSLAQQMANLSRKPWWAPTDNLQYGDTPGKSTGISNGGIWKEFWPQQKPWWQTW
jgi:RHS repeat-associated protein